MNLYEVLHGLHHVLKVSETAWYYKNPSLILEPQRHGGYMPQFKPEGGKGGRKTHCILLKICTTLKARLFTTCIAVEEKLHPFRKKQNSKERHSHVENRTAHFKKNAVHATKTGKRSNNRSINANQKR